MGADLRRRLPVRHARPGRTRPSSAPTAPCSTPTATGASGTATTRTARTSPAIAGSTGWVSTCTATEQRQQRAPRPGEVEQRLEDRFEVLRGGEAPVLLRQVRPGRPSDAGRDPRPLRALHRGSARARAIKQRWWRQVRAIGDRPAIGAISWLELARPEEEIDGRVADWRVTHRPAPGRPRWARTRGLGDRDGTRDRLSSNPRNRARTKPRTRVPARRRPRRTAATRRRRR